MSEETSDDPTVAAADPNGPDAHERVLIKAAGRYVLLERAGEGGMGEVFEAYDTKLDRRVALKFVRVDRKGADNQESLLNEAKALAKLSHPNVVTVFDAGMHENRLFVAMEFVDGQTMTEWYRERDRSWQEVVELMMQAGRGLEAAHAHGLIHRDFKPGNVMASPRPDGGIRARVLDFGIAVTGVAAPSLDGDSPSGSVVSVSHSRELTSVVGTPGYMAPEQFLGEPLDSRCDQFSFCVALYRMLYREPPFGSGKDLRRNVVEGRVRDPGRVSGVPGRLRTIVLRGLQALPDDRYPSMTQLLAELRRTLGQRRRRRLAAGTIVGALTVVGLAYGAASKRDCAGAEARLEGTWDPARRAAVAEAFESLDRTFAREALTVADERLDAFASDWIAARTRTCEDERSQSALRAEQTHVCLDRQLEVVAALVDLFVEADLDVARNAAGAVARLPRPSDCESVDPTLAFIDPPPASNAEEIDAVESEVARIQALMLGGQWARAVEAATALVTAAEATTYAPTIAQAQLLVAKGNTRITQFESARDAYTSALGHAAASGHMLFQAEALMGLCHTFGLADNDLDVALLMCDHAEALLEKLDEPVEPHARVYLHRGTAYREARKLAEAQAAFERALELTEGLPPGHRIRLSALNNLAGLHGMQGNFSESARISSETADWVAEHIGEHHPMRGTLLAGYGAALASQGKLDAARDALERANELTVEALGAEQAEVVANYHNLGVVSSMLGDDEAALESYQKSLEIKRRIYPEPNLSIAGTANNVAAVLLELDRPEDALEYVTEAVGIWEEKLGPNDPAALPGYDTRLRILLALDHPIDLERLEAYLEALGPEGSGTDPGVYAGFEFLAAKIIDARAGKRARARALVQSAIERMKSSQGTGDDTEMRAWLDEHP